jgi:hypothetical protein
MQGRTGVERPVARPAARQGTRPVVWHAATHPLARGLAVGSLSSCHIACALCHTAIPTARHRSSAARPRSPAGSAQEELVISLMTRQRSAQEKGEK